MLNPPPSSLPSAGIRPALWSEIPPTSHLLILPLNKSLTCLILSRAASWRIQTNATRIPLGEKAVLNLYGEIHHALLRVEGAPKDAQFK